jgi:hypothetical protein
MKAFSRIALAVSGAAVVVAVSVGASLQGKKGLERSVSSTISTRTETERGEIARITNRRFSFSRFYENNVSSEENQRTLLLEEEFQSERSLSEEGQTGTVTVQAWIGKDASPKTRLWTLTQEGDEGGIADRFYKVIKHGCCGSEATAVYFNLSAGRKTFTSTAELFRIEVPNTFSGLTRYVGYASDMASLAPEECKGDKGDRGAIGVIEYGSEDHVIDRVAVYRRRGPREDFGTPKIEAVYRQKRERSSPLVLWGADKKNDTSSLSAFSMAFSFSYNPNIQFNVPVTNDRFDLSKARAPLGFVIERTKEVTR